jgi:large subunit ribosomal protein L4
VYVIDELKLDEIKTAKIVNLLKGLEVNSKALIVTDLADENIYKSARNIKGVTVVPSAKIEYNPETNTDEHKAGAINVYDILNHDALILSKEAVKNIEEVLA